MAKVKLEDLGKLSIEIDVETLTKNKAKQCAQEINQEINKVIEDKKGNYPNSWYARKNKKGYVCKSKEYRLTHLLENGHLIVNKKSGVGWSAPRPHIFPVYEKIKKEYVEEAKELEVKIKLE